MASSPTVRRLQLAAELRRLRLDLGRTIDEVVVDVGISKSTLSRIENAQIGVSLPVLRGLLAVYRVDDTHKEPLEELAREARQRGWWAAAGGNVPTPEWRTLVGLEAAATSISDFSSIVLNGLLQTREYAEAVLRGMRLEEIDTRLSLRIHRQERISQFNSLWVVLAEEILHRRVGGASVMKQQLEHLVSLSQESRIEIQVIPFEAGEHAGLGGPFTLYGFEPYAPLSAIYLEGNRWEACLEDVSEVEPFRRDFNFLRAQALSPEKSIELLHDLTERI
jgi:transcriptional regulator with XRE-family HTH domain